MTYPMVHQHGRLGGGQMEQLANDELASNQCEHPSHLQREERANKNIDQVESHQSNDAISILPQPRLVVFCLLFA